MNAWSLFSKLQMLNQLTSLNKKRRVIYCLFFLLLFKQKNNCRFQRVGSLDLNAAFSSSQNVFNGGSKRWRRSWHKKTSFKIGFKISSKSILSSDNKKTEASVLRRLWTWRKRTKSCFENQENWNIQGKLYLVCQT